MLISGMSALGKPTVFFNLKTHFFAHTNISERVMSLSINSLSLFNCQCFSFSSLVAHKIMVCLTIDDIFDSIKYVRPFSGSSVCIVNVFFCFSCDFRIYLINTLKYIPTGFAGKPLSHLIGQGLMFWLLNYMEAKQAMKRYFTAFRDVFLQSCIK